MHTINLIDYIKENSYMTQDKFELVKYELDQRIYLYGEQFRVNKELEKNRRKIKLKTIVKKLYTIYKIINQNKIDKSKKLIISNSYFGLNNELKKIDFQVFCPTWSFTSDRNIIGDINLFLKSEDVFSKARKADLNYLISKQFSIEIDELAKMLEDFYSKVNVSALVVPNDECFLEKLSINICHKLNIPSFVFLHGLPGRYNNIDENRSDYLIVWGEKIKENYIRAGISADKIFVSGHPSYRNIQQKDLKYDLTNILIITKAVGGVQNSDKVRLTNRSNPILYLFMIENVLKQFGVKSVRFRSHPGENPDWYLRYINQTFYKKDTLGLKDSIENASLVIGPTSTVFLESLFYGVNYLVFEPTVDGLDLFNYEVCYPFNGKDENVPVAKNEQELYYLIKNKQRVEKSVLGEYIQTPFDLRFIKKLI